MWLFMRYLNIGVVAKGIFEWPIQLLLDEIPDFGYEFSKRVGVGVDVGLLDLHHKVFSDPLNDSVVAPVPSRWEFTKAFIG